MPYGATILTDSISPQGIRLTTMEVEFPRFLLAEFNTHRMLSRNSASSRAIPVTKQLRQVMSTPFVPRWFGVNRSGMQAATYLEGSKAHVAEGYWLMGRSRAVTTVLQLLLGPRLFQEHFGPRYDESSLSAQEIDTWLGRHGDWLGMIVADKLETDALNVHKQTINRLLEPYLWQKVVVTATEWSNFFALRTHADTQPEFTEVALLMKQAYEMNEPTLLQAGEWHLPLLQPDERDGNFEHTEEARKISAARCARVSYKTHHGTRDHAADRRLYDDLVVGGHMSPLEHVATPFTAQEWAVRESAATLYRTEGKRLGLTDKQIFDLVEGTQFAGNFRGWQQLRKTIPDEHDYSSRS